MKVLKNLLENKPKLIIAVEVRTRRIIDFKKFREICDKVKCYLLVDMAHFSGLVAGGVIQIYKLCRRRNIYDT